jgi:type 1 fimbria pilin
MKTKPILALALGTMLLTALPGSVQAIPTSIAGVISFSGSASTDNSNLSTATKFLTFGTVTVGQAAGLSGDYAGTAGAAVTFTPFTFDPVGASLPVAPLWTFMSGGNTYSFTLESLSVDFVSPRFLNLSGFGTASITGPGVEKLDTAGLWSLSGQTFGEASFTFSSSTEVPPPGTNVPDGGTTAMLLGFSVLGFGFLRRKVAA